MKIDEKVMVSFEYTLKNDQGDVLDSSNGNPLSYLHGSGRIIPGLEKEMTGKTIGDKFSVSIAPENAYGVYQKDLVYPIPRDRFGGADVEVGMQFQARTHYGIQLLTVVKVEDNDITVDANHPLAGQTLHFDVDVTEVREATEDEINAVFGSSCASGDCSGCSGC